MGDLGDPRLTPELKQSLVAGLADELAGRDEAAMLAERDALLIDLVRRKRGTRDLPDQEARGARSSPSPARNARASSPPRGGDDHGQGDRDGGADGGMASKAQNHNLPTQPDEIAESVHRSWKEGAAIAALHARRPDDEATCNAGIYKQINGLIPSAATSSSTTRPAAGRAATCWCRGPTGCSSRVSRSG